MDNEYPRNPFLYKVSKKEEQDWYKQELDKLDYLFNKKKEWIDTP